MTFLPAVYSIHEKSPWVINLGGYFFDFLGD